MSLIILPSQADHKKTFYCTGVKAYHTSGLVRGHPPPEIMAAICITTALREGCEDILVESQGIGPVRFTVKQLQEMIRGNPRHFAGWVPRQPKSAAARRRDQIITRHVMRTGLLLT